MRVLLVNDYPNLAGGAEQQLFRERSMLRDRGHEAVAVGFARPSEDRDAVAEYVLDEPDRKPVRVAGKVTVQPAIFRGVREVLQAERPDVVHLHKNVNYPASVLLACRDHPILKTHHDFTTGCPSGWAVYQDSWEVCPGGPGPKCVRHGCKSASEMAGFYGPQYALKNRLQHRYIDSHIAPSRRLSEFLESFDFDVRTIPYPAAEEFADHVTTEPGSERFVYVGRLTEEKGVQVLLAAIAHVERELDREVTVDIAGDGPYREELEARAGGLGIGDRVTFHGQVDHDRLATFYADARAVVVPSIWQENFPTVVIEALSMGRPVIGSDRGGIPELLGSGERGWVYDATDPAALAERLVRARDHPAEASEKGAAGLAYAEEYLDPARVFDELLDALSELHEAAG